MAHQQHEEQEQQEPVGDACVPRNWERVQELLHELEALEARAHQAQDVELVALARRGIFDELSQLLREAGLAVHRRGETLEAVSLAG